jgi:hypothetical protein
MYKSDMTKGHTMIPFDLTWLLLDLEDNLLSLLADFKGLQM